MIPAVVAIQLGRVDTPMLRALVAASRTAPAPFGLGSFSDLDGVRRPEAVAVAIHELLGRSPEKLNGEVLRLTADGWQSTHAVNVYG